MVITSFQRPVYQRLVWLKRALDQTSTAQTKLVWAKTLKPNQASLDLDLKSGMTITIRKIKYNFTYYLCNAFAELSNCQLLNNRRRRLPSHLKNIEAFPSTKQFLRMITNGNSGRKALSLKKNCIVYFSNEQILHQLQFVPRVVPRVLSHKTIVGVHLRNGTRVATSQHLYFSF